MRLIIDIQGFKAENNKFLLKEFAAYDGERISHYIFKQPYPLKYLSPECHKQAVWLMKNHHAINWNSGYTPLHHFSTILEELMSEVDYVYVKGKEKAEYIKKYVTKPVIEVDDQPVLKLSRPSCFFHSKPQAMCALSNVYYLYEQFFMNE